MTSKPQNDPHDLRGAVARFDELRGKKVTGVSADPHGVVLILEDGYRLGPAVALHGHLDSQARQGGAVTASNQHIHRVRTWADLEDWFSGAAEGHAVFYSPDTNPEWDDLWMRLSDGPEIGRGMRSFSLSNGDLRWLYELLHRHFGAAPNQERDPAKERP